MCVLVVLQVLLAFSVSAVEKTYTLPCEPTSFAQSGETVGPSGSLATLPTIIDTSPTR